MIQFPEPEAMIGMQPDDLAWFVLAHIREQGGTTHRENYVASWQRGSQTNAVRRSMAEAFAWLEVQQLLVPDPGHGSSERYRVSRRGETVDTEAAFKRMRSASQFSLDLLHPRIREKAGASYSRGDFGPAVLLAFVEVENGRAECIPHHRSGRRASHARRLREGLGFAR
ncbi:hypothetical protein [Sphingomonas sp. NFX23]|uniref:hypothetical protein n=1 Tax=Sphingomonas sp. NFX23 TaxID=2819532 RepID=UPI003CED1239